MTQNTTPEGPDMGPEAIEEQDRLFREHEATYQAVMGMTSPELDAWASEPSRISPAEVRRQEIEAEAARDRGSMVRYIDGIDALMADPSAVICSYCGDRPAVVLDSCAVCAEDGGPGAAS